MNARGNNMALGLLGWMAAIGNTHNRLTTADFLGKLEAALQVGKLDILHRQGKPVAWLIWRKPSPEIWAQLRCQVPHFPDDAAALANFIWLDFWVRPFGCDLILSQLVAQIFVEHGVTQPKLCWHDPSAENGKGRWYAGVCTQDLKGV
ncbi:toxin-activating lysine-acyltransferase [Herbaspirillum seropedicae]|uniref:toxin-activating lysine-acyltransferase n=1 Tax=Herbaspirillum seropedicae TaxID=964 RepID=UPI003FCC80E7